MKLKSIIRISFVLGSLILSSTAFATPGVGIFAEPYAGYGLLGGLTASKDTVSIDMGNYTGFGFGARVGARVAEMFFGGLDVNYYPSLSYSQPSNTTTTITGPTSGTKNTKLGLVAGVALPMFPLRFWLGYNFMDTLKDSVDAVGSTPAYDITLSGHSFKAGVGFSPIPFLSVNAEYIMSSYGTTETNVPSLSKTSTDTTVSWSHKLLLLSVSAPINFL